MDTSEPFDGARPDPFSFLEVEDLVSGFTSWVHRLPPDERAAVAAFVLGWAHTEGKRVLQELFTEQGPVDPMVEVVPPDTTLEFAMADLDRALNPLHILEGGVCPAEGCSEPILWTPSGLCCRAGHGGLVESVSSDPLDPVEEWGLGSEVAELRESQGPKNPDPRGHDPLDGEDCG